MRKSIMLFSIILVLICSSCGISFLTDNSSAKANKSGASQSASQAQPIESEVYFYDSINELPAALKSGVIDEPVVKNFYYPAENGNFTVEKIIMPQGYFGQPSRIYSFELKSSAAGGGFLQMSVHFRITDKNEGFDETVYPVYSINEDGASKEGKFVNAGGVRYYTHQTLHSKGCAYDIYYWFNDNCFVHLDYDGDQKIEFDTAMIPVFEKKALM